MPRTLTVSLNTIPVSEPSLQWLRKPKKGNSPTDSTKC